MTTPTNHTMFEVAITPADKRYYTFSMHKR
jgi:hypothetical protein